MSANDEARRRNRARVAQRFGDENPPPGLDGRELIFLREVGSVRAGQTRKRGRTEYAGGWRSTDFQVTP